MELKQIEGSDEDFSASFMVGSSDAGLTINTPLSKSQVYCYLLDARTYNFYLRPYNCLFTDL